MSDNTNTEIEWLQAAAERGDPRAQRQLGQRYLDGEYLGKDLKRAEMWLTMAAEQGDAQAQYHLAGMFNKDKGAEEDKKKAFGWYEKAAAQRHYESQLFLGMMYLHGDGVEKDLKESYKWFSLSEDSGREMFQGMAEKVAGEKMSDDEKDAAKKAADDWRNKKKDDLETLKAEVKLDNPSPEKQYKLGIMHLNGYQGIEKNIVRAAELIKSSAEQGYVLAQTTAGSEVFAAITLIRLAAKMQGEDKIPGLLELTIKQIKEADKDERPDFRMKNDLGIMLLEGTDIDANEEKAAEWLELAARQNNRYAQYNRAMMYVSERRLIKAFRWLYIAAGSGYEHIVKAKKDLEQGLEPYLKEEGLDMDAAIEQAKTLALEIKSNTPQ